LSEVDFVFHFEKALPHPFVHQKEKVGLGTVMAPILVACVTWKSQST